MATIKLVSSESITLTRELADKHHAMPGSPTERTLDPKRVKFLAEKIKQGLFLPPLWATVNFRGRELRMNGQHSSLALSESGENFPTGLNVHFDKYEASSEDDLVMLFRQFDARQSSRSTVDVSGAYMKLHENLREVDPALGLRCVKAVAWFRRVVLREPIGKDEPTLSGDDLGKLFDEKALHPFFLWMHGIEWSKAKELRSTEVMAAMFGTFEVSRKDAEAFWDAVIYRRHQFDDEHPATVLENYLMAVTSKEPPNGKRPAPAVIHEACLTAWNSFRAEKPIGVKVLQKVDPKKKGFSSIAA